MLSKNLSLKEVIKSSTAIKFGIKNIPNKEQIINLIKIAKNIFQPIRDKFKEPVYISSGFRSKKLNKKVNGSRTSQHRKGQALDLDQDYKNTKVTNADIFYYIKDNLEFDQLIWEHGDNDHPEWVHVSFKSIKNRNQIFIAYQKKNILRKWKTKYKRWDR